MQGKGPPGEGNMSEGTLNPQIEEPVQLEQGTEGAGGWEGARPLKTGLSGHEEDMGDDLNMSSLGGSEQIGRT